MKFLPAVLNLVKLFSIPILILIPSSNSFGAESRNSGNLDCYESDQTIGSPYTARTGYARIKRTNPVVNDFLAKYSNDKIDSVEFKPDASPSNKKSVNGHFGHLFLHVSDFLSEDESFFVANAKSTNREHLLILEDKNEARAFCDALINLCKNTPTSSKNEKPGVYGDKGKYVGLRLDKWRPNYWGFSVKYKMDGNPNNNQALRCAPSE